MYYFTYIPREIFFGGKKPLGKTFFWNFDEATPNVSAHWTLKCLKFCTKGTWNAYYLYVYMRIVYIDKIYLLILVTLIITLVK